MRYYIIAGEASGDLHGSNLIKGLKMADSKAEFRCWGGDLMQQAGGTIVKHYKESAIMGFVEVLTHLKVIANNFKLCKQDIIEYNPDLIILIDYPGFNLKMAKFAKERGYKVFYYIAPKVWAWKESRVKEIKRYVDKLFIIFPFEINYFKKWGIDAIYNGNPLLDSISNYPFISKEEFAKKYNLSTDKEWVALLAGSRKGEIKYLLPRLCKLTKLRANYNYILACAPSIEMEFYKKILDKHSSNITLIPSETYNILKHSQAAIVNSGTASLECALIKTPQVVCYGGNEISYAIARMVVKLKYISLANLILDKAIFKELLQHSCTAENIAKELDNLISNQEYINNMEANYNLVIEALGGSGASIKVAKSIIEEYNKLN